MKPPIGSEYYEKSGGGLIIEIMYELEEQKNGIPSTVRELAAHEAFWTAHNPGQQPESYSCIPPEKYNIL